MTYEITNNVKTTYHHDTGKSIQVRQIRKRGSGLHGGWVQDEHNLAQDSRAWIDVDSVVVGDAQIRDNGYVAGRSFISDSTIVAGNAIVVDTSIFGYSVIDKQAYVSNVRNIKDTVITDRARVEGIPSYPLDLKNCTLLNSATVIAGSYKHVIFRDTPVSIWRSDGQVFILFTNVNNEPSVWTPYRGELTLKQLEHHCELLYRDVNVLTDRKARILARETQNIIQYFYKHLEDSKLW